MALDWNIEKVKDWEELTEDQESAKITDSLVWATMTIGMREITDENYKEFYARLHLVEKLIGAFITKDGKPSYIERYNVQRRIGLVTNTSTKTRKQFTDVVMKKFYEIMLDKGAK